MHTLQQPVARVLAVCIDLNISFCSCHHNPVQRMVVVWGRKLLFKLNLVNKWTGENMPLCTLLQPISTLLTHLFVKCMCKHRKVLSTHAYIMHSSFFYLSCVCESAEWICVWLHAWRVCSKFWFTFKCFILLWQNVYINCATQCNFITHINLFSVASWHKVNGAEYNSSAFPGREMWRKVCWDPEVPWWAWACWKCQQG